MLKYKYPPLGGGGSNACKYLLKEYAKKNLTVDLVTASPSNTFETEKIGDTVNSYKPLMNKKNVHYWTQREIVTYSLRAHKFIKKLMKENDYNLCHAFFGIPCGAIAYQFRNKMPYIVSLRGSDVPGFNKRFSFQYVFLTPIIKKIWRNVKVVVVNSDVFVLPSLNEGMSNALLEAMASGLPVIVTDTGGTSELLDGNGMVVPKGDSNAIAQAVRGLMDDPEVRRRMGAKSREIAEQMGWRAVSGAYSRLYRGVKNNNYKF